MPGTLADPDEGRIAAIVVAHDGADDLLDCLASLVAQEGIEPEIIVVDNASTDGSIARVEQRFGSRVRVLRRATNGGYAAGANDGRRATDAAWIAILNQDLTLAPDCLAVLVDAVRRWPTPALVSPLLRLRTAPGLVNAAGNAVHWSGVSWCHGAGSPASAWSGTVEVPAVSGAAILVRAEVFDRIGGLDERFFMYMEDVDLSLRARSLGYACLVACEAQAFHDWRLAMSPEKFERLEANRRVVWARYLAGPRRRSALLIQAEAMAWVYATLRGRRHMRAKQRAGRRPPRSAARLDGRALIEPWLATRHPYEVLFPGRPILHTLGRLADRVFLGLAGVPPNR
jgi:GT2 family glycosyltransferase